MKQASKKGEKEVISNICMCSNLDRYEEKCDGYARFDLDLRHDPPEDGLYIHFHDEVFIYCATIKKVPAGQDAPTREDFPPGRPWEQGE